MSRRRGQLQPLSDGRGQECRRSGTIEGLKPLSDDHDDVLAARLSDGRGHECRRSGTIEGLKPLSDDHDDVVALHACLMAAVTSAGDRG